MENVSFKEPCSSDSNETSANKRAKMEKKFEILKKRRLELSNRGATKRRIAELQKTAVSKVAAEVSNEELQCSLDLQLIQKDEPQPKTEHKFKECPEAGHMETHTDEWGEVMKYFGADDRFKPVPQSTQFHLEDELESAIDHCDHDTADQLNDKLMEREFGEKLTKAFAAKRYSHSKEATVSKSKRKKHWGFESKARWESKCNM